MNFYWHYFQHHEACFWPQAFTSLFYTFIGPLEGFEQNCEVMVSAAGLRVDSRKIRVEVA